MQNNADSTILYISAHQVEGIWVTLLQLAQLLLDLNDG